MKTLKEIQREYSDFIINIPNYINTLKELLKVASFNYEIDEIAKVENFYSNNFMKAGLYNLSKDEMDKLVAAYFGVAFLWHFGGNWCLDTDKKTETYGQALIENYGGKGYNGIYVSPIDWCFFIETNQLGNETISEMFDRIIKYFANNKQFVLEPLRNIQ